MKKKRNKKQRPSQDINADSFGSGKLPAGSTPPIPASPKSKRILWILLALVAVNLVIYAQAYRYEFTGWDDPLYVSNNPMVMRGVTWQGLRWALTTGHASNWHPLTWLSHMFDVQLFGVNPGPIHCVNVLFHAANTLLLFWVLFRMTAMIGQSAFVAALFAAHPLHVESVAWISERKDVLSTFILLLTVLAYIAYVRKPLLRRFTLVVGFFVLALLAKPMAVTLPFVLLLLDVWPLRRIQLAAGQSRVWLSLIREKIPLIALAAASSAATLTAQWRGGTLADVNIVSWGMRAANAAISYAVYIGKMLWPTNLAAFYPFGTPSELLAAACLAALFGLSYLAIRFARQQPYFFVGWFWYIGTLVPVIGLIQVGGQARADRYTYVPLIGIFIIIAWGLPKLLGGWRGSKIFLAVAACTVVCAFTVVSRFQVRYWANPLVLWEHALKSTSGNYRAHTFAGIALMDRREVAKAIEQFNEALRLNPNWFQAHQVLGVALLEQGKVKEAMEHLTRAVQNNPGFAEARNSLGVGLTETGQPEEAVLQLEEALRLDPGNAKFYVNLGIALEKLGRFDEAVARFTEALQINETFVEARHRLGNALLNQGKPNEAIVQYKEALRLRPDSADTHHNMGAALMNLGRADEAMAQYKEALRKNPNLAEAHNSIGNAFARERREQEAMAQYREALRIKPEYFEARYNLGIALINQMHDEEAIVHLREALRLRPNDVDARKFLGIALVNTRQVKEAIIHLKKVLLLRPDDKDAIDALQVARRSQSGIAK